MARFKVLIPAPDQNDRRAEHFSDGHPGVFEIPILQQVKPSHFAAPTAWVALKWEGTYSNNIEWIQWGCSKMMRASSRPASQRITGAGAPDWKSVCIWGPIKRCADQTAETFSVKESARWRAASTRHHALQAPTDRLLIATHCTLHPSLALCSLFWVSRFLSFFFFFTSAHYCLLLAFVF